MYYIRGVRVCRRRKDIPEEIIDREEVVGNPPEEMTSLRCCKEDVQETDTVHATRKSCQPTEKKTANGGIIFLLPCFLYNLPRIL